MLYVKTNISTEDGCETHDTCILLGASVISDRCHSDDLLLAIEDSPGARGVLDSACIKFEVG